MTERRLGRMAANTLSHCCRARLPPHLSPCALLERVRACRFAVLIGLSNAMNELGVISFFASQIGSTLSAMNLGWGPLFGLLHVAFFYIHYLFASQTAHVGALFAAFLALMLGAGVPPMLAVLTLSFNVRPCNLRLCVHSHERTAVCIFSGQPCTQCVLKPTAPCTHTLPVMNQGLQA